MGKHYEYLYLENLNNSENLKSKIEAVQFLGKIKSELAIPELEKIVKNKKNEPSLRINGILALTLIGSRKYLSNFIPLISEEDDDVIEIIIKSIGKLGAYDYISEFDQFINHPSKAIKKEIINTLLIIDNVASLKMLLKFYSDKDSEIKELVRYAIKRMQSLPVYIENINEIETLNILSFLTKEKSEKLIKNLINKTEDEKILNIIIKAISDLELENEECLLQDLYHKTEKKSIKLKILEAFEKMDFPNKKNFLLNTLNDDIDREIKVKVLFSFGSLAVEEDVVDRIKEIISNKEEWWLLRKVAIMLIGENKIKSESDFLIDILVNEGDARVSRTLINELGELENKKALPFLKEMLKKDEIETKKVTILSLSKLGDKDVLEILVNDDDARNKLMPESLKAIINFNDKRIISILIDIIDNVMSNETMIELALEGLKNFKADKIKKSIIKYVNNKNNKREYRGKAIMILATYSDQDVKQCLENLLKDETEWWMIKKMALLIIDELLDADNISIIVSIATNIDERISKTAKKIAKSFYEDYFLDNLHNKCHELAEIAKLYVVFL